MIFNSTSFLVFFLIVFALYYAVQRKGWQLFVLIASSAVFYGWHQPQLLGLLLLSMVFNTVVSWAVYRVPRRGQKIALAALGIVLNVGLLVLFKYTGMLVHMFDGLFHSHLASGRIATFLIQLPLPIGISFYTFEGICLLVDTLRGDESIKTRSPGRLLRDTALFISFFPHLIAGPIVRPRQFMPQIGVKFFKDIDWRFVGEMLIIGYFLKVFVADNLAETVDSVFPLYRVCSGMTLIVMMFLYSIRVFGDYAGYSYIAVGLAAALGYKLPINFNWPFVSQSISEVWTRWNITLGSWLKEYVYFPLGGNRGGTVRTCINLMLVMLVAGIWHGADLRFVFFGASFGLALCVERLTGWNKHKARNGVIQLLATVTVFTYFSFTALLSAMPVNQVIDYCKHFYLNWNMTTIPSTFFTACVFAGPVIIWHVIVALRERGINLSITPLIRRCQVREAILASMLFLAITNPGLPKAFVYFQF